MFKFDIILTQPEEFWVFLIEYLYHLYLDFLLAIKFNLDCIRDVIQARNYNRNLQKNMIMIVITQISN